MERYGYSVNKPEEIPKHLTIARRQYKYVRRNKDTGEDEIAYSTVRYIKKKDAVIGRPETFRSKVKKSIKNLSKDDQLIIINFMVNEKLLNEQPRKIKGYKSFLQRWLLKYNSTDEQVKKLYDFLMQLKDYN